MNLKAIVDALGGTVYAKGRRASIPHPGHRRHDRSVSLFIDDHGRLVIKTFGDDGDWRKVKDLLRRKDLLDDTTVFTLSDGAAPSREADDPVRRALVVAGRGRRAHPVGATSGAATHRGPDARSIGPAPSP